MTLRRSLLMVSALLLAMASALWVIVGTNSGSRWLLQQILANLPAKTSVQAIEGRLIDRIELSGLHYQSESETVGIDRLILVWNASSLLRRTLAIADLTIEGARIVVSDKPGDEPAEPFQFSDRIVLPLNIVIANLDLKSSVVRFGNDEYKLDRLQLSAASKDDSVDLRSLSLEAASATVKASGRMQLGNGFPGQFDVDWRRLRWPLSGKPQFQSNQGSMRLSGSIDDYRVELNGGLVYADLQDAALTLAGQGSRRALSLTAVELKSNAGLLSLTGEIGWEPVLSLDLTASGRHFNPAIFSPDLPGDLTFSIHAKGKPLAANPAFNAELHDLNGSLRSYPVKGSGSFELSRRRLHFGDVNLASGSNRLSVDGIAEAGKSHLKFDLKAPRLDQLWPGLAGSLNGNGTVRGDWHHPEIGLKAAASDLQYAGHRAERINVGIDYYPEAGRASVLRVSAKGIYSSGVELADLELTGNGTQERHRFDLDIKSSYGDLKTGLNGQWRGKRWQGKLSTFDLNSRDWEAWRLQQTTDVVVTHNASGLDAELVRSCLTQHQAKICVQGNVRANGDMAAQLILSGLPLALLQRYLPENASLQGVVNGNAELQQKKSVLNARYRLDLPGSTLRLQTAKAARTVGFGASTLSGTLRGDSLDAEWNLALPGHDYVRGEIKTGNGKTRKLSGRINASVDDFTWIQPFIPIVDDVKGRFRADLILAGRIDHPELHGSADLTGGIIQLADHRIDRIMVEAHSAKGDKSFQIQGSAFVGSGSVSLDGDVSYAGDFQLDATASGLSLSELKPYLPETLVMTGSVDADARVQSRQSVLKGDYRIAMPAGTRITVSSEVAIQPVTLNASTVTGTLDGRTVTSNFDLGLTGQDYVRGRIQLDTGERPTIAGRIQASVAELAWMNPLVPQLSSINGRLTADLALQGSPENPEAQGSVALEKASVDIPNLGLELRKIDLRAETAATDRRRLEIRGFVQSGSGYLNLGGDALLQAGWPIRLTLTGKNFQVARLPEAEASVSPDLSLTFAERRGDINGSLVIDSARIEMKELPENSVNVSDDEIVVGEKDTSNDASAPKSINVNVEVDLGKNVKFSGLGLKTGLTGKLRITKAEDKLAVNGNVNMKEATYKSYGQDLTVRKGQFVFNGPADNPWFDVEATRLSKDEKVTAILRLTGPAKSPKTSISSEPALPEGEALAYLITGSSLNRVSQSEGNVVAAAALSYGAGKMSWLVNKLGVDEFEVKEGDKLEDTMLAVGQYLNPDFYVGAKVGLFNKQTALILRQKLTDSISVESQSGDSQRVKLNYEIEKE